MTTEYLIRKKASHKIRAHIWTGEDTACRMYSTGGLSRNLNNYRLTPDLGTAEVCSMCASNADLRRIPLPDTWDEWEQQHSDRASPGTPLSRGEAQASTEGTPKSPPHG